MRTTADLTAEDVAFLTERHVGTLTTLRADGTPHVVAIAFTLDGATVRIITTDGTQKVRNVEANAYAAVSQVDGRRWLALEGPARVVRDAAGVAAAVAAFERRYRQASENMQRVAIEIEVRRVLGPGR